MKTRQLITACALTVAAFGSYAASFSECPTEAFLIQNKASKLYSVDLATGYYQVMAENLTTSKAINAIGFNHHDKFLYGWNYDEDTIMKMGDDFVPQLLDRPTGIPAGKGFYVGDVSLSENVYYVYQKSVSQGLYKIPLDENDPNYLVATKIIDGSNLELRIYDFAFHPTNGFLYTVDRDGQLLKINPAAGNFEVLAQLTTKGTFGAVYFDVDGNLYYSRNNDGNIFRVDPESQNPTPVLFAYGPSSSQNDGARCALAPAGDPVTPTADFGDAPSSYGSTFDDNGARHNTEGNSLMLGDSRDAEADAFTFPSSDDGVGTGYDDGIQLLSPLIAGENTSLRVSSSGVGKLAVFFDWNGDGDFNDVDEAIGDLNVQLGDQLFNIVVPGHAVEGETWARFRLSSQAGVGATGGAPDGEVEDYQINILPCACSVTSYPSGNDVVTLAYEDLWPSKGDYDMNDLVVHYGTEAVKSGSQVVSITIKGEVAAVGAAFHNGFAVRIPGVAASNIDVADIRYKINGEVTNRAPLESGRTEAIIVVTEDTWNEVVPAPTCGFYRTQLSCDDPIAWSFSIHVPFVAAVDESVIGNMLLDPFLFGTNGFDRNANYNPANGRDLEVHLKNISNTEAADMSFFDRAWDASQPAQNLYYLGDNGIPFALEVGTRWAHPLEGVDIVEAYPDFINYVLSGGTTHQDWYLRENADESKIYPH